MYNKEDRAIANDRYRAVMKQIQNLNRETEFEASCRKAMAASESREVCDLLWDYREELLKKEVK